MDRLVDMLAGLQPLPPTRFVSHEGHIETEDWQRLVEVLGTNKEAVGIRLRGCGLTCFHARQLADALAGNTSLECLELPDNGIGEDGVKALVNILQANNSTLKSVDLSDNPCSTEALQVLQDLDALLKRNRVIKKLPKTPQLWTPRESGDVGSTPALGAALFFTPAQAFPSPTQQVNADSFCNLTPPAGLAMYGTAFNVEQRLQHLEEAEATIRSELEHARSFSSQSEMWQRKIDMAGQQIAAILSLVDSRNMTLETRLHTMERWRAGAEQAWADQSKVFEGMAAQLLGLQVRVQSLERHIGRPDASKAASDAPAAASAPLGSATSPVGAEALQQEVQALAERLRKLEGIVGDRNSEVEQHGPAAKPEASPETMCTPKLARGTEPGCRKPEPPELSFGLPNHRSLSSELGSDGVTPVLKGTALEAGAGRDCGSNNSPVAVGAEQRHSGKASPPPLQPPLRASVSPVHDRCKRSPPTVSDQRDQTFGRLSSNSATERDSHSRRRGSSPARSYDVDAGPSGQDERPRMAPLAVPVAAAQPHSTGFTLHRQPCQEGANAKHHSGSKRAGPAAGPMTTPEALTGSAFSSGAAATPYGVDSPRGSCSSPGTPPGSTFSVDAETVSLSVALANSAARPRAPGAATTTHGSPPTAAQRTREPGEGDGCWGSDPPRGRRQTQEESSESECSTPCRQQRAEGCGLAQQATSGQTERHSGAAIHPLRTSATSDAGQTQAFAAAATATPDPFSAPCLSVREWVDAAHKCATPPGVSAPARPSLDASTPTSKLSAPSGPISTGAAAGGPSPAHAQEASGATRHGRPSRPFNNNAPHSATSLTALAASMEGTERRSSQSASRGKASLVPPPQRPTAAAPSTASTASTRRVATRDSEQTHDQGPGNLTRAASLRGGDGAGSGAAGTKATATAPSVRSSIPSLKLGAAIPRSNGTVPPGTCATARPASTSSATHDCPMRLSTHRIRKSDDVVELNPAALAATLDGSSASEPRNVVPKLQLAGSTSKQQSTGAARAQRAASAHEPQDTAQVHDADKDQMSMSGEGELAAAANSAEALTTDSTPSHLGSRNSKTTGAGAGVAAAQKLQVHGSGGSMTGALVAKAASTTAKGVARYAAGDAAKASKRWM
ncbi:hypothetical protein Agub_g3146 [Astrephomene gubernaculifera]|uniref:Uncharacterized protein n=1 Tax=Astrephomene gubernaculifera TaxID=47775 RepID=A0AAD3DI36_9CHLO|nr:hypothetical protein Agub_g3146 [Astrephomene gubernaculifera]